MTLLRYSEFLAEASKKTGYNDDHATAHLWNSIMSLPNKDALVNSPDSSAILREIESAKTNTKHPLNQANAPREGYVGGVENPEGYYVELKHAAATVHALANHPSLAAGGVARVTGAESGNLSDLWKANGGKDRTSKADIIIQNGETQHPISLKKGDSQLMSAQPNEFMATYDHATRQHMQNNPKFKESHRKSVMDRVNKIAQNMEAMKTASRDEQIRLKNEAQQHINDIHTEHPGLLDHVHYEAATGHGKFGQGQAGTARYLVTSMPGGSHIHDTETGHEPIVASVPRVALPKGRNRPGNVKIDYKALKVPKPSKVPFIA